MSDPFATPDEIKIAFLEDELARARAELVATKAERELAYTRIRDIWAEVMEGRKRIAHLEGIVERYAKEGKTNGDAMDSNGLKVP